VVNSPEIYRRAESVNKRLFRKLRQARRKSRFVDSTTYRVLYRQGPRGAPSPHAGAFHSRRTGWEDANLPTALSRYRSGHGSGPLRTCRPSATLHPAESCGTQPERVVAVRRLVRIAVRRAAIRGGVVEAATPVDTVRAALFEPHPSRSSPRPFNQQGKLTVLSPRSAVATVAFWPGRQRRDRQ